MATVETFPANVGSETHSFTVNGRPVAVNVGGAKRLSRVLRDDLGLTGTKIGCDAGDCGACTVRLDGRQVCACLVAMGQMEGRRVDTVESLTDGDGTLSALQRSFLDHGAAQCGICTPGMILAAVHLLSAKPQPTLDEIREGLSGNLCRCTGYTQILEAVEEAARRRSSV